MKKQRPRSVHPLVKNHRMHRNTPSANNEGAQLPRVLLVEDHDLLRRLISDMLNVQASVETSISAREAIEKARTQTFDALVLDISLGPGGNGIDVMTVLRQDPRYRTTPMIACTAIVGPGYEKRLLKAGFDAYLAKPFEPAELQQLVAELIADRNQTDREP